MATSPALKRNQATRGHHHPPGSASPRKSGSAVTFDVKTSIYPLDNVLDPFQQVDVGTLRSEPDGKDEEEDQVNSERCYTCNTLLERRYIKRFFRICAVLNLLSLAFSAPLRVCTKNDDDKCDAVVIQFIVIAVVDLIVAILYTLQLFMRTQYTIFLFCQGHNRKSTLTRESIGWFELDHHQPTREKGYKIFSRLLYLVLVTLSLWYSVGIGVHRIVLVKEDDHPSLDWFFYLPLILRSTVTLSAMNLFVHLKIPTTALNGLIKNFRHRWKQLASVTLFYIFFIYIYALFGVQWLGGLNNRCHYAEEIELTSIPTTHCNNIDKSAGHNCFDDPNAECVNDSGILDINYRNTVYLGQFRTIIDALFAVYEASSLELWSFMEYNALNGAPRPQFNVVLFYITMVFFLVVFVQQSIFLVVIIESFADLRSDEAVESSNKQQNKPTIVLFEQRGGANEIGFKHIKTQESLAAFKMKLNSYYYSVIEKGFILLVLVDALVTATKHTDMSDTWAEVLKYWQLVVSICFLLEVVGLFLFHLLASPMQLLLLVKNYYFWYLLVVALGSLAGAIPIDYNNPMTPGHWLAIFQALRLPRALRLVKQMRDFFSSIIGDGVRLLIVVLIVLVFLVWFAVVSMQIFGYLETEAECDQLGSDMFRDFFHSFQSMFQLLMQEGWSQLFSEIMCHRNYYFILINLYFIILHLIASLILLNFFVAVILDNLDYDEDVKVKKLEEAEKNVEKVQEVPYHLRIFQLCGPKKISVPKLSSADTPHLTEADVRNFYNIGEVSDFPRGFVTEQPSILPSEVSANRRISELSNLSLLTEDNSAVGNGISAHQGKYWGVQGILSYIKAYRQHNRENEGNRPNQSTQGTLGGDFLGTRRQVDSSTPRMQNEYDEYREKYRLFDTALFCMPPEHKLRQFCGAVLTRQMKESPAKFFKDVGRPNNAKTMVYLALYMIRLIVSQLPYFTWFMIIVTITAISIQIHEINIQSDDLLTPTYAYLWWMDLFFIIFTLIELLLKIVANGFFFNPHAAIQNLWDVIDWIILLSTLGVMIAYLTSCQMQVNIMVTYNSLPLWMLILLIFRALRPLRLISLVPKMRHVLYELLQGWKNFLLVLVLLIFFIFMFASLGVQLFAGEDSPEGFCNDPMEDNRDQCNGEFLINIQVSLQESLPLNVSGREGDVYILVPRVWYPYRRNFRFDTTANALLTLFEVLTLEGWLDVRDLFGTESDILKNSYYSWLMFIYIHIFVFLGVNFGLQLFVGIVVNNFNEHKPDHSALLTVSQKRWTDLLQRLSLTRPIKKPPPPRGNKFRMVLYNIFVSPKYKHFGTLIISINSALFWVPWSDEDELRESTIVLMSISVAFTFLFSIEVLLKIIAFSCRHYSQSWRNIFDFSLLILGCCYIAMAILYLVKNELINLSYVTDVALVFTVLKLLTILMKYSIFQNLLITVVSTLFRSVALVGVLLSFLLVYAFVGNLFFSSIQTGEAIDYSFVNFNEISTSLSLMIRVVTGEDWHTIFQDTMVHEPYCSVKLGTCGVRLFSIVFFISFYVLVSFILLNVIIAVLLERFSIFYNEDDTELNHAVVSDFKMNWLYYDKNASGLISSDKIKLFLRMLKLKEFYTFITYENGIKERQRCNLLSESILLREMAEELRRDWKQQQQGVQPEGVASTGNSQTHEDKEHSIPFQDVLRMLAHRAEDITHRLVPHQLYIREELEQSVQFDVAEQCILMWIQKFVKPVIKKQEKHRRQTVSHNAYRHNRRDEDSLLWPPLIGTDDRKDKLREIEDFSLVDSDDDIDHSAVYSGLSLRQSTLPHSKSEEESVDFQSLDSTQQDNSLLMKSYMKLESAPFLHFQQQGAGGKDKWHEWFQMQKDWMNNVEEDPDNYFDDNL